MDSKRLRNKVALITSTSDGALAAAKRFSAEGAEVIVIGRDVTVDPTDEQNVARLFATLGRKHGRLDILFLNAGSLTAPWLALKHAVPILSDGAAVIVDTSTLGRNVRVHGISLGGRSADEIASAGAELAAGGVA